MRPSPSLIGPTAEPHGPGAGARRPRVPLPGPPPHSEKDAKWAFNTTIYNILLKIRTSDQSEKDAKLAQKLGQLQPFIAMFPRECMGQLASFGPTEHSSRSCAMLSPGSLAQPSRNPLYNTRKRLPGREEAAPQCAARRAAKESGARILTRVLSRAYLLEHVSAA